MSGAQDDANAAALLAMATLHGALRDMLEELPGHIARAGRSREDALAVLAIQEKQLRWLADAVAGATAEITLQGDSDGR